MAKANKQQLGRLKAKQKAFIRLKSEAELAVGKANVAKQELDIETARVVEECGLDPTAVAGWVITDDGEIKPPAARKPAPVIPIQAAAKK